MGGDNTLLQLHDLLAGSQPRVNRSDIYDKISGKLKKRAPNAYMLFRLQLIKYFKGTGHKPDQINSIISRLWGNLDSSNKQNYILVSRKIQRCLDHGANVEPFFSIDSYGKVLRSIPDIFEVEGKARVAKKKRNLGQLPAVHKADGSFYATEGISDCVFEMDCNGLLSATEIRQASASF